MGTVKTITASTPPSRSMIRSRWRFQRGVTQREMTVRTALSEAVSGGRSSVRLILSPPRRPAARRLASKSSPSR